MRICLLCHKLVPVAEAVFIVLNVPLVDLVVCNDPTQCSEERKKKFFEAYRVGAEKGS